LGGALYFYPAAASISNEKQKRAHVYGHAFLPSHVHCAKSRFLSHVDVASNSPVALKISPAHPTPPQHPYPTATTTSLQPNNKNYKTTFPKQKASQAGLEPAAFGLQSMGMMR
jgi:hypothetical protein